MKVYRTAAGAWVSTQAEWREKTREEGGDYKATPEPIEVPINPKASLVAFLNGVTAVSHAVHVEPQPETESVSQPDTAVPATSPLSLEEQIAKAPLRRRLGWAVEAIDAAEAMMMKMSQALRAKEGG